MEKKQSRDAHLELVVSAHSPQSRSVRLSYATELHIRMSCYHDPPRAASVVPKEIQITEDSANELVSTYILLTIFVCKNCQFFNVLALVCYFLLQDLVVALQLLNVRQAFVSLQSFLHLQALRLQLLE